MQITKIGRRISGGGSTASDGWLYFYFDEPFVLGSQYRVTSVYARFYKIRSASGKFTGDVPVRVDTSGGRYDLGEIGGYTFPASTDTNGTTISGYLETSQSVMNALASVEIERIELGQSDYDGGKDIRCLESSTCDFILDYEYAYSNCYWGSGATCSVNKTLSTENVTLSWSGAQPGTANPIARYHIYYEDSADGWNWGAPTFLSDAGLANSASVSIPDTPGHYRRYTVYAIGSVNGYNSDGKTSTNAVRRDHGGLAGFTDPTLTARSTPIKAIHMTELQERVNTLRAFYGMSHYGFSTIAAGTTKLSGWSAHIGEIRSAIDELCSVSSKTHDAWLDIPVNCPRVDVMEQLRRIVLSI